MDRCDVAVVGLGYVGLTLAVALAEAGMRVAGVEANPDVRAAVAAGRAPFAESGLAPALAHQAGRGLAVAAEIPRGVPTVFLCVATPVDPPPPPSRPPWTPPEPRLEQLLRAAEQVRDTMDAATLVIVRSTVPVGTTVGLVAPILAAAVAEPLLAMCPERTIQGSALAELRTLPQVVGATSPAAADRASALFARLGVEVVRVSSPSAAEAVKLINNAHTDVIYGFGNEVALLAERLGLDAAELIHAANHHYPRPDLCGPGFVGGSCLTKDPYLLLHSLGAGAAESRLVRAARELNEAVPALAWHRVEQAAAAAGIDLPGATVLLAGVAYKGRPQTDDTRGSAAVALVERLRGRVDRLLLQDFEVAAPALRRLDAEPVELADGAARADIILLLNDHPGYGRAPLYPIFRTDPRPRVVWDGWGVCDAEHGAWPAAVRYLRFGRA
ncbi:MAG TPA: nucleotide sugar dehydrogenase [Thermoanaerobaculia bacterium]|jgi:UDP-N-acetyl-D-mannosaminuronic acid dehydrogenase|nr:nucleotide sugar dehydrogenase [Thermoanaerobaculia bacterium]